MVQLDEFLPLRLVKMALSFIACHCNATPKALRTVSQSKCRTKLNKLKKIHVKLLRNSDWSIVSGDSH